MKKYTKNVIYSVAILLAGTIGFTNSEVCAACDENNFQGSPAVLENQCKAIAVVGGVDPRGQHGCRILAECPINNRMREVKKYLANEDDVRKLRLEIHQVQGGEPYGTLTVAE